MGELLKKGLVFCMKSLDLVEVLIFGEGFIKVRVGNLLDPLKHLSGYFCGNYFWLKQLTFFCERLQLRCLTDSKRRFQKHLCFVRDDFAS